MVEMAKAHDLNICEYLKFLLEHRPTKEMPDEELAELAPWSEKLQSIKNHSELLQPAKGWGNFVFGRSIIWRLPC